MVWLGVDSASSREVMLTLPRVQPANPVALEHWLSGARAAARLDHPHLAGVAEVGVQDHWPFISVDRGLGVTLSEWLGDHPQALPDQVAAQMCSVLQGLAFAHEAGVVHLDLQLHSVLIDERGSVRLMGLACANAGTGTGVGVGTSDALSQPGRNTASRRTNDRTMALDPADLRAHRAAATRDLVACGLLLQHLLTGQPALDEPDTSLVIARMTPHGREVVRLPWTTPLPIPEALRAIVNRCTSAQERLRYQSARTLLGALTGWLEAQAQDGSGPAGLLLDRLSSVGHLPALPGLAARVARVTQLESQRTDEIADQVLHDLALSFELLRTLHSAQVQGTQVQGNGPVLTLRRVVALIGVDGVRLAANALRTWPGPLSEVQAAALQATLDRVRLAGYTAQALRPAGYDAQVAYLIAVLQNLGRLMVAYHFADEAEQIRQLMKFVPAQRQGGTLEQPGLSEVAAAFAVLGVDIETLGAVAARSWGLGEEVTHMARRLPLDGAVRKPDSDAEVLRLTASAANEAVDAISSLSGPAAAAAIAHVATRYARVLGIGAREIADALQTAREVLRKGTPMPAASSPAPPPFALQQPAEQVPELEPPALPTPPATALPITPQPPVAVIDRSRAAHSEPERAVR